MVKYRAGSYQHYVVCSDFTFRYCAMYWVYSVWIIGTEKLSSWLIMFKFSVFLCEE